MSLPSTVIHQRVKRGNPRGGAGSGGSGAAVNDFGTWIGVGDTTPKDLRLVGDTTNTTGTVTDTVTFGVEDPNSGTWAMTFDGDSGRIALAARFVFSTSVSLSCWVKTTSADATSSYEGSPALVIFGDTNAGVGFQVGVTGGKFEARRFNGTVWQTVTHPTLINNGGWHHCALSWTGTALLLYVDGVLHTGVVSGATIGGITHLGCGFGTADFFDGSLYLPTAYHLQIWKPYPIASS